MSIQRDLKASAPRVADMQIVKEQAKLTADLKRAHLGNISKVIADLKASAPKFSDMQIVKEQAKLTADLKRAHLGNISKVVADLKASAPRFDFVDVQLNPSQLEVVEGFFDSPELTESIDDPLKWAETAIEMLKSSNCLPSQADIIKGLIIAIIVNVLFAFGSSVLEVDDGRSPVASSHTEVVKNSNIVINLNFPNPDNNFRIVRGLAMVHQKPRGKSAIINAAVSGECVEVLEVRNRWRRIKFSNCEDPCEGWVRAKYLKKIKPLSRHWQKNNSVQ